MMPAACYHYINLSPGVPAARLLSYRIQALLIKPCVTRTPLRPSRLPALCKELLPSRDGTHSFMYICTCAPCKCSQQPLFSDRAMHETSEASLLSHASPTAIVSGPPAPSHPTSLFDLALVPKHKRESGSTITSAWLGNMHRASYTPAMGCQKQEAQPLDKLAAVRGHVCKTRRRREPHYLRDRSNFILRPCIYGSFVPCNCTWQYEACQDMAPL